MSPIRSETVSLRLYPILRDRLRAAAKIENRTVSNFIESSILRALKEFESSDQQTLLQGKKEEKDLTEIYVRSERTSFQLDPLVKKRVKHIAEKMSLTVAGFIELAIISALNAFEAREQEKEGE